MTTTDGDGRPARSLYNALMAVGAVGCVTDAPADLSTNPVHMEGFGRPKNHTEQTTKENEMTTLTIDESVYEGLAELAADSGMSVETWLAEEVAAKTKPACERTPEERLRKFRAFLGTVESWNPDMDDSRESMYPVRP